MSVMLWAWHAQVGCWFHRRPLMCTRGAELNGTAVAKGGSKAMRDEPALSIAACCAAIENLAQPLLPLLHLTHRPTLPRPTLQHTSAPCQRLLLCGTLLSLAPRKSTA